MIWAARIRGHSRLDQAAHCLRQAKYTIVIWTRGDNYTIIIWTVIRTRGDAILRPGNHTKIPELRFRVPNLMMEVADTVHQFTRAEACDSWGELHLAPPTPPPIVARGDAPAASAWVQSNPCGGTGATIAALPAAEVLSLGINGCELCQCQPSSYIRISGLRDMSSSKVHLLLYLLHHPPRPALGSTVISLSKASPWRELMYWIDHWIMEDRAEISKSSPHRLASPIVCHVSASSFCNARSVHCSSVIYCWKYSALSAMKSAMSGCNTCIVWPTMPKMWTQKMWTQKMWTQTTDNLKS